MIFSRALARYLKATSRLSRFRFFDCAQGSPDPVAELPQLLPAAQQDPIFYPFWNQNALLLLTLCASSENQIGSLSLEAAADDSLGGRITAEVLADFLVPCRLIRYQDPANRLEDLQDLLRRRPNLCIAADSHGPYRQISPGMARLTRAYPYIAPFALRASRFLPVFRRIGMKLPLPGGTIDLYGTGLTRLSADTIKHRAQVLEQQLNRLQVLADRQRTVP